MTPTPATPLQIGVTGGIGSGKSVVCRIFAAFGIPVYEADARAKWLVDHDAILRADVVRLLGRSAYDETGRYNRAWVAAQVFGNPALLDRLNALIHPRVQADALAWASAHRHAPYVVREAALMRAAGDNNTLDKVIVVQAPLPLRLARIRRRDPHRTDDEINNIIARQISDDERLKIADFVVHNDEAQLLTPQLVRLHELFINGSLTLSSNSVL